MLDISSAQDLILHLNSQCHTKKINGNVFILTDGVIVRFVVLLSLQTTKKSHKI